MTGLSSGMSVKDIAEKHGVDLNVIKQQLKMGTKVEMEHTKVSTQASRIAMDHLVEDPRYYTKLIAMEKE